MLSEGLQLTMRSSPSGNQFYLVSYFATIQGLGVVKYLMVLEILPSRLHVDDHGCGGSTVAKLGQWPAFEPQDQPLEQDERGQ